MDDMLDSLLEKSVLALEQEQLQVKYAFCVQRFIVLDQTLAACELAYQSLQQVHRELTAAGAESPVLDDPRTKVQQVAASLQTVFP
ncbi:hypothetical protein H4R33_002072 [Dimargaris cristalligena]|nr:hypothetical protein H4R33_002072 [Dimargaris cristalligena]